MEYTFHYETPLGGMTAASDGTVVTGLWFDDQKYYGAGLDPGREEKALPVFEQVKEWLDAYFGGGIPVSAPPLAPKASGFGRDVLELLLAVPYGRTVTYGEIAAGLAEKTGKSVSPRAVGQAVGRNPIMLIIPCHRVLGKGGSLTGYAGGIERKTKLLTMEKEMSEPGK